MSPSPKESAGVVAVLLAAGASRRFAGGNKLLAEVGGEAMVARIARRLTESRADAVIVVTGFQAEKVAAALRGLPVHLVENTGYASGLASSVTAGIAAVPAEAKAALLCLADMPGLTTALIDALIAAFQQAKGQRIVYTRQANGDPGSPVLWPRRLFGELMALEGDSGAKPVLLAHLDEAVGVAAADAGTLADIDTRKALAAWKARPAKD